MKAPALAAVALLLAAAPAAAREGGLQVLGAWSRPAMAGGNGAGYLTLVNHGKADALVGVDSGLAQKVEMHASSMAGGVMRMSVEDRVPVPAGGEVTFAPGGRHLMLIGLKRALRPGDLVPATLHFASGAELRVKFAVAAEAPPTAGHAGGMPGMHDMH